jgi:RNA polymerase sigma-70 factor (TIGR02954 family)
LENDSSLVQKALNGNDEAFLELMQKYKTDIYKAALAYFRNENDALEAVQEVTFRAYQKIDTIREPSFFKTWLIRIMINYCNDQVTRRKRFIQNEELIDSTQTTDSHERIELEDVIETLDARSRELIKLKYFHDMRIQDIAAVLKRPEGTIKTWLHKALASLRAALEEMEGNSNV